MGKKRKSRGSSSAKANPSNAEISRFHPDETFEDSEDEILAGRDHILLDEGPEAKRRRRLQDDGLYLCSDSVEAAVANV